MMQASHGIVNIRGNELDYTPYPSYAGPDIVEYNFSGKSGLKGKKLLHVLVLAYEKEIDVVLYKGTAAKLTVTEADSGDTGVFKVTDAKVCNAWCNGNSQAPPSQAPCLVGIKRRCHCDWQPVSL